MSNLRHGSQSFRQTAIFFVALLSLALVGASTAFAEISCAEGDKWAEENRDSLPQTIEEFTKVSDEYRSSAFQALSTQQKTKVWHEHLGLLLEERVDLTEAQLDEIRNAGDLFENVEAYDGRTQDGVIGMALGTFVVRLSGDFLVHEKGKIQKVMLPNCNCDTSHFGCSRVWCIPTQGCSPFDCGGRW